MAEYIEREAVLKAYLDLVLAKSKAEKSKKGAATFRGDLFPLVELTEKEWVRLINAAPAADVAPVRHGRWVVGKDHGDFGEAKCTACGGILLVKWSDRLSEYRYCPNCGAKMDLEGGNT